MQVLSASQTPTPLQGGSPHPLIATTCSSFASKTRCNCRVSFSDELHHHGASCVPETKDAIDFRDLQHNTNNLNGAAAEIGLTERHFSRSAISVEIGRFAFSASVNCGHVNFSYSIGCPRGRKSIVVSARSAVRRCGHDPDYAGPGCHLFVPSLQAAQGSSPGGRGARAREGHDDSTVEPHPLRIHQGVECCCVTC